MQSATVHVSPTTSAVCSTADRVHTPFASDVDLLRDLDGIIDLNAQMAHDALDLRAPEAEISNRAKRRIRDLAKARSQISGLNSHDNGILENASGQASLVRPFSRNW
jgi:hypothetical protein